MQNTWNEIVAYRLNFIMWRMRTILALLVTYYLWLAIIPAGQTVFGYSQPKILTYLFATFILNAIVLSTRTQEIGENINSGDLSTFLTRPFNYFGYWFARDIGDKMMNIFFAMFELTIFYVLFRPPLFIQTNMAYLIGFLVATFLAICLYFLFGILLGLIGFWSSEVWAPRFIFSLIIMFFAGMFFPLDIFPKTVYTIFQILPFAYLLYFPIHVYLGQVNVFEMVRGICISIIWIGVLLFFADRVWKKGLRQYGAYGR